MRCQCSRRAPNVVQAGKLPTIFDVTVRETSAFAARQVSGLSGERGAAPATRSRRQDGGAPAAECAPLYFPMYLMSWEVLHSLPRMVAHQKMLRGGGLVQWALEMQGRVIFVSHEWLGTAHPDPAGEQLAVLKGALRRLASGKIALGPDVLQQLAAMPGEIVEGPRWAAALPFCFFWLDFAGVPQLCAESNSPQLSGGADHRFIEGDFTKRMMHAVASIPAYVERCAAVVVLTPVCKHQDDTERVCNFASWCSRGWCRMELVAALLSRTKVRIIKCVGEHADLAFISGRAAVTLPPGEGSFTCCAHGHIIDGREIPCDRQRLRAVIESMLGAATEHFGSVGELLRQRYFRCRHQDFLRGLPAAQAAASCADAGMELGASISSGQERRSPLEEFDGFLRWRPEDEEAARAGRGWTRLHWAAFAADAAAVRAVLSQGDAYVEAPAPHGFPEYGLREGYRPLHLAVFAADRSFDAAVALLEARADPMARTSHEYHMDSLMILAMSGHVEGVRCWLDRFPSWDMKRCDLRIGSSVLGFVFYGKHGGAVLAELLYRRVDPHAGSGNVSQVDAALFQSVHGGNTEAVQLLLQAGCSPTVALQPPWLRWQVVFSGARIVLRLRLSCGLHCGSLWWFLANCEGASPLHIATRDGNVASMKLLLNGRADPTCRNRRGWTPLDWADHEFGGHTPNLVAGLLGRS